jgi:hypothetical protein
MHRYLMVVTALALAGCAVNPPPSVVSQNQLGITIQARKALDINNDIVMRDRYIAGLAQQHCASYGKTAQMTMRDAGDSGPGWVTTSFDCR